MSPPKNRFEDIIWEINCVYAYVLGQFTKEYGRAPYRHPEFKNRLKPSEVVKNTMDLIEKKLNENLYSPKEKIHILKNTRYVDIDRMNLNKSIANTIGHIEELDPTTRKEHLGLKAELESALLSHERCVEMVMNEVQDYISELESPQKDKRKSEHAPNNHERIRALKEFAPELIKALEKTDKETKGKIVRMITGVNVDDSYQLLFTKRANSLDKVELKDLELYKEILGINQK